MVARSACRSTGSSPPAAASHPPHDPSRGSLGTGAAGVRWRDGDSSLLTTRNRSAHPAGCVIPVLQLTRLLPPAEGSAPRSDAKPPPLIERITSELVLIEAYAADDRG